MKNKDDEPNEVIPLGSLNWGQLRRQKPVSTSWGFDRGQPVDRYYIENFIAKRSSVVRGDCLEVMNNNYTMRFGGSRVTRSDVLDIDSKNENATIIGDLTNSQLLAPESFDCFILTQTLSFIFDIRSALENSFAALKPGGSLIITVPAVARFYPQPGDYWRFTRHSLAGLIEDTIDCSDIELISRGNLIATIGFLEGIASNELTREELDHVDHQYPIVIAAHVLK